jgi:hypothetical protein
MEKIVSPSSHAEHSKILTAAIQTGISRYRIWGGRPMLQRSWGQWRLIETV